MLRARPPLRLLGRAMVAGALSLAALAVACADSTTTDGAGPTDDTDAESEASRSDSSSQPDTSANADAGPKTTCELTKAYDIACSSSADLNCGDGFDAWCTENDTTMNSEAWRRAEAECLTQDNCKVAKRRECEYAHFNGETPTASQTAIVAAYCQRCEPGDVSGCKTRSTTYDPAKGVDAVPDIFIAAWEIADEVVDEMKAKCTGADLDAGPDTASCAKAFGGCTADIFLARTPNCPN